MNADMHELLLILDRATLETRDGQGWVAGHALRNIPRTIRNQAQTKGWMIGQGATSLRKYKITAAGRTALANNAQANMAVMDQIENGYVPTGDDDADPLFIVDSPTPPNKPGLMTSLAARTATAPQKNSTLTSPLPARAQACVQAIGILGESFPEVIDLVDSLMKINARKAADHE